MVEAAGGESVLAGSGERSQRINWEQISAEVIDVTVFMPCGFDLEGAVEQARAFLGRPEATHLGRIYAVDANACFSRPGPRLVDGVELLGELFHPSGTSELRESAARRLQPEHLST
jgi:iron complex transport system substrate-binding protein